MIVSGEMLRTQKVKSRMFVMVGLMVWLGLSGLALGQAGWGAGRPEVGIDEQLGATIDLDLTFYDETGKEVSLKDLIDKPTVLTLVYYRCPGLCSPLLNELAMTVDQCELEAGQDYQLLTVSFDPRERENPDLAKNKKYALLGSLKKSIPESSWRFMTGKAEQINALTEAVGFKYMPDKEDFSHAGTVIFLSQEGKIVRYLDGGIRVTAMGEPRPSISPVEMKFAIIDAMSGTPRNLMKKIQGLCFAYERDKGYVLKVNRLILGVTVLFVLGFGSFLLLKGRKRV